LRAKQAKQLIMQENNENASALFFDANTTINTQITKSAVTLGGA